MRTENIVWVRLENIFNVEEAKKLGMSLQQALRRKKNRLVLDLTKLVQLDGESARQLSLPLKDFQQRIRLVVPSVFTHPHTVTWLAGFGLYGTPLASQENH